MIRIIVEVLALCCCLCWAELLPSLELKPSGYVFFTNETKTKTKSNVFSLYVKVHDEVQDKQHIISIRSKSRDEQFIKLSLIQMQLSLLINLRHPAVSHWFMIGEKLIPEETYYIKIDQNGPDLLITLNNVTISESLESVEDFVYPVRIAIGSMGTARGINGSVAGLRYNNVNTLYSYIRRDNDFKNVGVEMGGEVSIKEQEWETIDEKNKEYCPHNNHFPKSEVGTEFKLNCQQNIARAVCGENKIWLVEKCKVPKESTPPKGRSGDGDDFFSTSSMIIYIGIGAAAILVIIVIIIIVLVRRKKRHRIHRYKMTECEEQYQDGNYIARIHGVSTLPMKLTDSLTTTNNMRNSLEMSCSTLDNAASDILDNRIPVFTTTQNPLNKPEDLFPVYMTSDNNLDRPRDEDIISTILGERTDRTYNNMVLPNSLLNSTSGLNSEVSWQDV